MLHGKNIFFGIEAVYTVRYKFIPVAQKRIYSPRAYIRVCAKCVPAAVEWRLCLDHVFAQERIYAHRAYVTQNEKRDISLKIDLEITTLFYRFLFAFSRKRIRSWKSEIVLIISSLKVKRVRVNSRVFCSWRSYAQPISFTPLACSFNGNHGTRAVYS